MLKSRAITEILIVAGLAALVLTGCAAGDVDIQVGESDGISQSEESNTIAEQSQELEDAVNEAAALDPRAPSAAAVAKGFLIALAEPDCETFEALSTPAGRDSAAGSWGLSSGYYGCAFVNFAADEYYEYSHELEITFMDLTSELRQRDGGAHVVLNERFVSPSGTTERLYTWNLILEPDDQHEFVVNYTNREFRES